MDDVSKVSQFDLAALGSPASRAGLTAAGIDPHRTPNITLLAVPTGTLQRWRERLPGAIH